MSINQLVTHEGFFHADDVMAGAVLKELYPNASFIRSRNEEYIKTSLDRIVWDVGHTYNHDDRIYDHHQAESPGTHRTGTPYAAFGLIWKHYGNAYLEKIGVPSELIEKIWTDIEINMVDLMDAEDTGHAKNSDPGTFMRAVKQKIPNTTYSKQDDKWIQSAIIGEPEYYQNYLEMVNIASVRLKHYVNYLINATNQKYNSLQLRNSALIMLNLALKQIAGHDINKFFTDPNFSTQIKYAILGKKKLTEPFIKDSIKNLSNDIFKNLKIDRFQPSIQRKLSNKFLTNSLLSSSSMISLIPMIEHSILGHIREGDDQFKDALKSSVAYASEFIANYITSLFSAATGHEMVDEYINQKNVNDHTLILPGPSEYVSRVYFYNSMHPNNVIKTVVYPVNKDGQLIWTAKHIQKSGAGYETYIKFPPEIRGKTGDDIAEGLRLPHLKDKYIFAHNAGHLLTGKDKDAVLYAVKMSS